jgi:hypothetical protein
MTQFWLGFIPGFLGSSFGFAAGWVSGRRDRRPPSSREHLLEAEILELREALARAHGYER